MTNRQFCNFLGGLGCLISFFGMGLLFFGVAPALWGVIAGIGIAGLSLVSYN